MPFLAKQRPSACLSLQHSLFFFPSLFSKPVHIVFDEAAMSSDGGGLLLKAVDDELGLTASLAICLRVDRQAG